MAVTSVTFYVYVNNLVFGADTLRCRTDQTSNNWHDIGTTELDATNADWESTNTILQSQRTITGVGWWGFAIDPATINFSLPLYVRLSSANEGDTDTHGVGFYTQNYSDPAFRPYLEIKTAKLFPFWKFKR